ncbi:NAD(P)H-quinone oxidoreductase subunit S, chloroplastic [Impatiens glandulifera]|uniref:NAD(P)H-quinone oxidoreductase subunit S, chloroplastic n=1 Tax=Impatiens glandulifera TaxID=253017 RepID=UPI001FB0A113|nr:NAD(P)H-quinone oxidoreductase subunit S, chloroplastic [Impatiens glandulifera]
MASSSPFLLQGSLLQRSSFIGKTLLTNNHQTHVVFPKIPSNIIQKPNAKFNLFEIMGGRGLCNGEEGIQKELKRPIEQIPTKDQDKSEKSTDVNIPEDGFDKEMLGLTGGFPGGEKGLKKFIEENPPPKKSSPPVQELGINLSQVKKPKPPELPLLMPGMIALVKNSNSPYYMYCGIVQRITDGKAGVLLEGGVWDRLITFRLDELERREKGPPGVNPRSVILEGLVEKDS